MKERSQEIGMGSVLHFPCDIRYLHYADRLLAISVETANWIVLPNEHYVVWLNELRSGKTVGEVLSTLGNDSDRQSFLRLLSAIIARRFAGLDSEPKRKWVEGYKMLNIYLTNACNLSCPHCFMNAGKKLSNELTEKEWKQLLSAFAAQGGKAVTITGGEPLMNSGFADIVKSAHKDGLQITVLTNGILWTDSMIDELSPLLSEVQVSIDGPDDISNGKVRKVGIFDRLVNTVIRFAANGVRVSIATTFTEANLDAADGYAAFVTSINEATGNKVAFKLTKKILPGRETHYSEEQNRQYESRIRAIEEQIAPYDKYEAFMDGHSPNLASCNCGFGGLSIAADGEVYFCNRVLEVVSQGNVKDHPITYFLRKGEQAHFDTGVDQVIPCRDCALKYICGGGCRIDEYDFKGREWTKGQTLRQLKCMGPSDNLLKMMVESYEYQYSF